MKINEVTSKKQKWDVVSNSGKVLSTFDNERLAHRHYHVEKGWAKVKPHKEVKETTSAGAVATVAAPIGKMQARNKKMYNSDGTMKNALDQDNILSNSKVSKKKR
jgi:hypothetical protein